MAKRLSKAAKWAGIALFTAEINRLNREYGPVRLARLDVPLAGVGETLVVSSPIFCTPGDVQLPAVTVLDTRLYNLGVKLYGSIATAAREFRPENASCQFKDC